MIDCCAWPGGLRRPHAERAMRSLPCPPLLGDLRDESSPLSEHVQSTPAPAGQKPTVTLNRANRGE